MKPSIEGKRGQMIRDLAKVEVAMLEHSGYFASLMKAPRLQDNGMTHGLPPGHPIGCYPLACLPGAPEGWVQGPGSYVVPVDTEYGLWFQWTMNNHYNTAIVASVKGMNPITGQKLEALRLEQYRDKCPVHDVPFAHGRFCEKCGYEWPPQNYVCYPNTLWWDGFRNSDGTVRQFFFTDEDRKDVASAIIGKQNTVPAFGFAFFHCKKERLQQMANTRIGCMPKSKISSGACGQSVGSFDDPTESICMFADSDSGNVTKSAMNYSCNDIKVVNCSGAHGPTGPTGPSGSKGASGPIGSMDARWAAGPVTKGLFAANVAKSMVEPERHSKDYGRALKATPQERRAKDVSVGAGAVIGQGLVCDPLSLEDWHAEPKGLIRLYFVFAEQLEEIYERGGVKELVSKPEGYLAGVEVG